MSVGRRMKRRRVEAVAVHWHEADGPAAPAAYLNNAMQRTRLSAGQRLPSLSRSGGGIVPATVRHGLYPAAVPLARVVRRLVRQPPTSARATWAPSSNSQIAPARLIATWEASGPDGIVVWLGDFDDESNWRRRPTIRRFPRTALGGPVGFGVKDWRSDPAMPILDRSGAVAIFGTGKSAKCPRGSAPTGGSESNRRARTVRSSTGSAGSRDRSREAEPHRPDRDLEEHLPVAVGTTQRGGPMKRYAIVIEDAWERAWRAYGSDLPGCVATGESEQEVERLIREAIACTWREWWKTACRSLSRRVVSNTWRSMPNIRSHRDCSAGRCNLGVRRRRHSRDAATPAPDLLLSSCHGG